MTSPIAPRRILGHDLVRLLGEGGMGAVYELHDAVLDTRLALKVLKPEYTRHPQIVPRFRQEAMLAARVKQPPLYKEAHRHVVRVLAADELEDGSLYILMDYMEGVDLERFIVDRERLDEATVVSLVIQICNVLNTAHKFSIAHRDLKAANVFITSSPELDHHVKLLDFGLASLKESIRLPTASTKVVTMPGQIMGTLAYMAPEQMAGSADIDGRADIFALGVLIYRMLTGLYPYPSDSFLELARQKESMPAVPLRTLRPYIDPGWDEVLARCLAFDRDYRYPNVRMVAIDVARTIQEGATVFGLAWPRFAAEAEDFTVKNDGTIPERHAAPLPIAVPLPSGMDSSLGSMSNAAGAIESWRRPTRFASSGRLAALATGAAAVAALVVGLVARGFSEDAAVAAEADPEVEVVAPALTIASAGVPPDAALPDAPVSDASKSPVDAAADQAVTPTSTAKPRTLRKRVEVNREEPEPRSNFDPNGVLGM